MPSPRPELARFALSVLALVTLALTAPPVGSQVTPWCLALGFTLASVTWDGATAGKAVYRTLPGL